MLKIMILRDLSRKEKIAVLKSMVTVAGADGHLSNSESSYLGVFLIRIGEDQSILNELNTVSNDEVIRILRNLNYSDKQDLLYQIIHYDHCPHHQSKSICYLYLLVGDYYITIY